MPGASRSIWGLLLHCRRRAARRHLHLFFLGSLFRKSASAPYADFGYTTQLATAFAPAALGGWQGAHSDRVSDAFAHMEATYGKAVDSDGDGVDDSWMYATDVGAEGDKFTLQMWATAALALGTARDTSVLASIYDGSLAKEARAKPHLLSLSPAAPVALVRRAVFSEEGGGEGSLQLELASSSDHDVNCTLTIATPAGWERVEAAPPAAPPRGAPTTFEQTLRIGASAGAALELKFRRSSSRARLGAGSSPSRPEGSSDPITGEPVGTFGWYCGDCCHEGGAYCGCTVPVPPNVTQCCYCGR